MTESKVEYWLTEAGLAQLREWYNSGLSRTQIALNCEIKQSTLSLWCKQYPAIAEILCVKEGEGRVLIGKTRGNCLLTFYLRYKTDGVEKKCMLHSMFHGLFRTWKHSEHVYIDQFDLIGQRVPYIPVRRVRLRTRHIWIQTDKDISKTHQLGEDIKQFYV